MCICHGAYVMCICHAVFFFTDDIRKDILEVVNRDLILGLVLLEGAFPKSHLKPGVKHFVHYPRYTGTHSLLRILWMMAFERWVLLYYLCI